MIAKLPHRLDEAFIGDFAIAALKDRADKAAHSNGGIKNGRLFRLPSVNHKSKGLRPYRPGSFARKLAEPEPAFIRFGKR